ncbi:unnamed protein product [Closterium sp. NIES-53]
MTALTSSPPGPTTSSLSCNHSSPCSSAPSTPTSSPSLPLLLPTCINPQLAPNAPFPPPLGQVGGGTGQKTGVRFSLSPALSVLFASLNSHFLSLSNLPPAHVHLSPSGTERPPPSTPGSGRLPHLLPIHPALCPSPPSTLTSFSPSPSLSIPLHHSPSLSIPPPPHAHAHQPCHM